MFTGVLSLSPSPPVRLSVFPVYKLTRSPTYHRVLLSEQLEQATVKFPINFQNLRTWGVVTAAYVYVVVFLWFIFRTTFINFFSRSIWFTILHQRQLKQQNICGVKRMYPRGLFPRRKLIKIKLTCMMKRCLNLVRDLLVVFTRMTKLIQVFPQTI